MWSLDFVEAIRTFQFTFVLANKCDKGSFVSPLLEKVDIQPNIASLRTAVIQRTFIPETIKNCHNVLRALVQNFNSKQNNQRKSKSTLLIS